MNWFCCGAHKRELIEAKSFKYREADSITPELLRKERERLARSACISNMSAEKLHLERPIRGIDNLGNSCYISAAIQCLSNTRELSEFMLTDQWQKDANTINPIGTEGQLLLHYVQIAHKLWDSDYKSLVEVGDFKKCLDKNSNQVEYILT